MQISSRWLAILPIVALGCAQTYNPTPPASENQVLTDAVQLTHGFLKAGEAYFSPDSEWIIFQATTKPDEDYQMYVAKVKWRDDAPALGKEPSVNRTFNWRWDRWIAGIETPVRISPSPSFNTCGYFSPDGESLIFASTALNPKPKETTGGYQRDKGSYRWTMPDSQIFRADGWKGAVSAVQPGGSANLAQHPLTRGDSYKAECAWSPDGKWIVYAEQIPLPAPKGAVAGGPKLQNVQLFVMRSDGSKQKQITHIPGYNGGPFFSPDGKRLAYRCDRKGDNLLQIYVADLLFDAAGDIIGLANERQLTREDQDEAYAAKVLNEAGPATELLQPATTRPTTKPTTAPARGEGSSGAKHVVNWAPYWHPDGRHLVWATSIHGHRNYEVYLMRDDGTRKTRVTFSPGFDGLPSFSHDGNWMMWTSSRGPEKTSQIWVARFRLPEGN